MNIHVADPGAFGGRGLSFLMRARARGRAISRTATGFALPEDLAEAAGRAGLAQLKTEACTGDPLCAPPRIALYCGTAIGFPYWAYYAHALLACGLPFRCFDAKEIATGVLDEVDLLVMPGGFATWGLDRAETTPGVDNAIRHFLDQGGSYVGSCGGAFYACEGRPNWLGLFRTVPLYTQEYLRAGAGLVSITLTDTPLARGLPPALELPYYHGPLVDPTPDAGQTGATFRSRIGGTRLFIDNPMPPERFAQFEGRPALLWRNDKTARIVVFSPHPEMGEFLRRGMALDDYVRHYLPIRGPRTMEQTLDFLGGDDSAGFRLIANAVDMLCPDGPRGPFSAVPAVASPLDDLSASVTAGLAVLRGRLSDETPAFAALCARLTDRLEKEWSATLPRLRTQLARADPTLATLLSAILARAGQDALARGLADPLIAEIAVLTEMPIRLATAALRCLDVDQDIRNPAHD